MSKSDKATELKISRLTPQIIFPRLPEQLQNVSLIKLISSALIEDLGIDPSSEIINADLVSRDVTSFATLDPDLILRGQITSKQTGILAGLPIASLVFYLLDQGLEFETRVMDGQFVQAGDIIAELRGSGRAMLTAERTALNFLGRMSGIATLTSQFVNTVSGTRTRIVDTRKTAPGLRLIDKYAVRMGGGTNHRMGLFDMALIKDNHIDGAGSITAAVNGVRQKFGARFPIEVEVKNLEELAEALSLKPERVMLDNMNLDDMREAVRITQGAVKLEASGNVSLERVRAIAEIGVDFISVGALTHSAPVFDVSLRMVQEKP